MLVPTLNRWTMGVQPTKPTKGANVENENGAIDAQARERIEALEGKVMAAQVAIRALIACHPTPERAIQTVCEHLDRFAGIALAGSWSDEMTNALAAAQNTILPTDDELRKAQR